VSAPPSSFKTHCGVYPASFHIGHHANELFLLCWAISCHVWCAQVAAEEKEIARDLAAAEKAIERFEQQVRAARIPHPSSL